MGHDDTDTGQREREAREARAKELNSMFDAGRRKGVEEAGNLAMERACEEFKKAGGDRDADALSRAFRAFAGMLLQRSKA